VHSKLALEMPRWKELLLRRGKISNSDVLQAFERVYVRLDEIFPPPPSPGTILTGQNEHYSAQQREWQRTSFENFVRIVQEELGIQWHHIVDRRVANLAYVLVGAILGAALGAAFTILTGWS
jgi:hypothetical protein